MEALVNKIIPFSSVDGPGNRTAIFLQGCNYNCRYCHNPETIGSCGHCGACLPYCPTGAISRVGEKVVYDPEKCCFCDACFKHCPNGSSPRVQLLTAEQVMARVKRNMPFIRGITVSGGECTRWPGFLTELLTLAKQAGLDTLLDSNGSYDFSADPALMAVCDGVMLDVKAWDRNEHIRVTGIDNDNVRKNLLWLAQNAKLEEVRTVVVPGLFDTEETVRETCRLLAPYTGLRDIRYKIICYRPMGVRQAEIPDLTVPDSDWLRHLEAVAHAAGIRNKASAGLPAGVWVKKEVFSWQKKNDWILTPSWLRCVRSLKSLVTSPPTTR